MNQPVLFGDDFSVPPQANTLEARAKFFCDHAPHRTLPYSRRDWGGPLHSLCSYQGKLKPAIAHFLVSWFTQPGHRVLDPMAGVGTIPLEARRLGRIGIANDLSPLAACVSRAKLEPFRLSQVERILASLQQAIDSGPSLESLTDDVDVEFGLNKSIRDYFHPDTLREVLIARHFFSDELDGVEDSALDVVRSSVLHILHGNRPYALSRRSHPVTPFAPSGPFERRPLLPRLRTRLDKLLPLLVELQDTRPIGIAIEGDFRELAVEPVDWVITSPPFSQSLRFWSMNWMRLWFVGWEPQDFVSQPPTYLETQQKTSFKPYREFSEAMARILRPEGGLIMHLGETAGESMADRVIPELQSEFDTLYLGHESVSDTESHGLTDKGSTQTHWYLFARKR